MKQEKINDFQTAKEESFGLFDTIHGDDWFRMKQRVIDSRGKGVYKDFSCLHEFGESETNGRWVCNPHQLTPLVRERQTYGGNGCLIYLSGDKNFTRQLRYANRIQKASGDDPCWIHIFGTIPFSELPYEAIDLSAYISYHDWDFTDDNGSKSLEHTMDDLGHSGNVVDIFSVACDQCRIKAFTDLFMSSHVKFRQVLLEVPSLSSPEMTIFLKTFQNENYVTFHREVSSSNEMYSFLKLRESFFKKE